MAFRFRFENILKYRENIEKQKISEFLKAQEKYYNQKKKVEKLEKERDSILDLMKELSSSENFDIATFNMVRGFVLKLEDDIKFEQEVLIQLKEIMEIRRRELLKATQDKKIMEKLRERDYNAYMEFINKKETIELDEITSKNYNKNLRNR